MRFLIQFSYDGTSYSGFQTQRGKDTIQERLENALTEVNNHQRTIAVATGRTDKGVHALCQYAHADLQVNITEAKLKRALNSHLPDDIHVIETKMVEDSFHARYQVKEKTYEYLLNMGEYNPLERNTVFQYNHSLDIEKMKEAISFFLGTHDFRAFVTDNKEKDNCIRTITKALIEEKDQKIRFLFSGDGFLRYQVRNMVGILIRVGEGKILPEKISEILESKDRTKSGKTAPPEGLCLLDVKY
ncbi:MAG: tRNA pseudouridine(38-40) synthase TruA [Bacilli bacterium]|nr:tRNA pseudouridine(38-40) synthase TruA [Bacilli bacterium]